LREGDAIELVDGLLVRRDRSAIGEDPMAHGPRHATAVSSLQDLNARLTPLRFHARSQLPITLGAIQAPEPDLAVIRGARTDFMDRHPTAPDVAAVFEVSDSSLEYDRTTKQRIYATARIPVYLIVNLPEAQIELYENPLAAEGRYARRTDHKPGQTIRLVLTATESVEIALSDILPA
jgi:Uma2 family endonuclease